jgi:Uncharacterised nucleotidyltransferase
LANLRVDDATGEVLRALDAAGVEPLLLKGASVARWLYHNQDPRPYVDCDLLVAPDELVTAEAVLGKLGFAPPLDPTTMPTWWQEHGVEWVRSGDGATIDLHRTLPGVGVEPDRLWLILLGYRETIRVAGFEAVTVAPPARAFLLVLHAAHHGAGWKPSMSDLRRAISIVDIPTWQAASELAGSLDAIPTFAAGLGLTPEGRQLASELGLPRDASVEVTLKAASPPPLALGFEQLAQAKGLRRRIAILRYKLVPPPTFMRHWSPRARQSRLGLVLAYAWRPIWLLRNAPAGFKAWREARRASSGS